MPEAVVCEFDEDGNGLDDEIEAEIAQSFVPEFRFDASENELRADEPHVVFSILRSDATELLVKYVVLFEWDGGFPCDNAPACSDFYQRHHGDTQVMIATIKLERGTSRWFARLTKLAGFTDGETCCPEWSGDHPVVYSSAGKHHFYKTAGGRDYHVVGGASCLDNAYGNLCSRVPQVAHAPLAATDLAPPVLPGGAFGNVCHHLRTGQWLPASGHPSSLRSNALDDWGYPGQTLDGDDFYSAGVTGVVWCLNWGTVEWRDGDGDGIMDSVDRCPWQHSAQEPDPDGDGLVGICDPSEGLRNRYVAAGNESWPAVQVSDTCASVFSGGVEGFLNTDQDYHIDGPDLCPASAGSNDDKSDNRWGEEANLIEFGQDDHEGGSYRRGNRCDPYPATSCTWLDNSKVPGTKVACEQLGNERHGYDVMRIRVGVSAGVSDNDPLLDQPNPTIPPRTYRAQTFRCRCDDFAGDDCLGSPLSLCHGKSVARPGLWVERWRGWREVERPGCSHGETGFCEPYTLDAGETTTIEWDWLDERTARPDHYAYTGDFVTETRSVYEPGVWPLPQAEHVESVYEYALWTQTLEGASFDAPPGPMPFQQGPRSNLYPDPEAVDTALLDIESTRSRRMRASHASPMPLVQSHFEVKVNVNVPCPTFPIGWLARDMVGAWLRDYLRPAGDITLPDVWRSGPLQPPRPWVLVQGVSKRFDSVMLLPQGAVDWRNVAAPAQLPWLAETVGHAAVLRPAEPGGNGSPGSTHVLWLEDGGRQRWALVEMDLATGLTEFIAQGILDEPAFEACRLVHDRLGLVAVLVDVARGGIRVFDRELRAWAPRRVDVRALAAYEDAAMAVLGTKLVVAGGRTGGGMLVDLFGGQPQPFDGPPRRLGARLDVASDGSALLFYGGVDSAGDRPDDVWRIALSNPAPVAELLWRATGSRQPAEDLAVMTGSADGGHVYFHSIVPSDVPSVHTVVRTDRGWFETDESGQPTVPAGQ